MLRMSIIDGRIVSKSPVSSDVVCMMAGSVFVLVRVIFFFIYMLIHPGISCLSKVSSIQVRMTGAQRTSYVEMVV